MEKYQNPSDMQTALDCAIRDYEGEKGGYKVKSGTTYYNYKSNEAWNKYLGDMDITHKNQYDNGGGGELYPGKYPPKMASFGSSSRFIYDLSKGISGFKFEEKLDTKVGGVANLDGFLKTTDQYIYIEAKRREIYGASHANEKIKVVYENVYKRIYEIIKDSTEEEYFKFDMPGEEDDEGYKKCTFKINNEDVKYFDLKQLICHFLGITYDIAKHSMKDIKVTFLYLLYNPSKIEGKIDKKYRKKVLERYEEVTEFIKNNIDVIKSVFQAVLQYQIKTHGLTEITIDFNFKLVDQNNYINALK